MKAEILSVGTELLLGQIVNTDAQYLSQRLSDFGIDVYHHSVVGDNNGRLKEALALSLSRSELVITTGGLGPTMDDLTKETVAEFFSLDMRMDEEADRELREWMGRYGREITPNNLKQAVFPVGSKILKNRKGTAPGCIVEQDGKIVIILPGPPFELKDMFEQQVAPFLRGLSDELISSRILRVFGVGESRAEHLLRDMITAQTNPTIAPYAGFGEVTLRITAKCASEEEAERLIAPVEAEIRARLGDTIYGTGEAKLDACVSKLLVDSERTLAVAESCTGGMLMEMLTATPGISASLLGGGVAYSNDAKTAMLGVPAELIEKHGAVSAEVAQSMALGAMERFGTDYAVATTGIAGPGGATEDKPVGLVYIAVADAKSTSVKELRLHADRERVRRMTCLNLLDMLRRRILNLGESKF